MALTYFSAITQLPTLASGTKPDAIGDLWNTRYDEIDANFELLEQGSPGEYWAAGGGWSVPTGTGITNGHVIQDEGTPLTQRANLDFIGNGVTAADGGTATEVTIPGLTVQNEGTPLTFRDTIDFIGDAIAAADGGTKTEVTVTAIAKGSAFPGSPSVNDVFYKSDEQKLCYWDGANWITVNAQFIDKEAFSASIDGSTHIARMEADEPILFDYCPISTLVAGTNDGTNYWTVEYRSLNAIASAATTVYSFLTNADTVGVITDHSGTPSTPKPANYGNLYISITATGSPGTITIFAGARYKLIIG